ncbi:hypothetical protein KIPB_015913, partial [Kipferlia bialata]
FTIVCSLAMEMFPYQFCGLFSDDPEVVSIASTIVRVIFSGSWIQASSQVANVISQVYHNVTVNILVNMGRPALTIILEYTLPMFRGNSGVWEGIFISDVTTGLVGVCVCVFYVRKMARSALDDQKEDKEGEVEGRKGVDVMERGTHCASERER